MKKILLIIDDDAALLTYLCGNLGRHFQQFTIMSAGNGERAAEILASHPVGIIITDLNMPVMDGFELLTHMAKHYPDVPVFVMTGNDSIRARQKLAEFRIAGCFPKPFLLDELASDLIEKIEAVCCGEGRGLQYDDGL